MAEVPIDTTAYHEAGHILIALLQKKIIITDAYSDGEEGFTRIDWDKSVNIDFEKLCFFIAGEISERIFIPEKFQLWHVANDRAYASSLLFLFSDKLEGQREIWKSAVKIVGDLLKKPENAAKIKKIAETLTRKNYLSGEEIMLLMKD